MLNPHHLMGAAGALNPGLFMALRIAGDVRTEFEQLQSLIEAGINESSAAVALDCPARTRACNIGRLMRDVLAANARLMGELEQGLRAAHVAAVPPAEDLTGDL